MNTLKQQQPPTPSIESGFTLIECLIAIIIVGVLMVAIAPAVVLATATRLQARRVELATQAARTYVDGVRSGSIATPNFIVVLNELNTVTNPDGTTTKTFDSKRNVFSQVTAPGAILLTCPDATPQTPGTSSAQSDYCYNALPTAPSTTKQSLYCINLDGQGCAGSNNRSSKNMIVQAFRSASSTTDTGSGGYILGVRVYRLDAFDGSNTVLKTTPMNNNRRTATYTAGVGDNKAPLVELTTEIAPATTGIDPSRRWKELCKRLGGAGCPQ
jgi:prepilin-type N-terminal cleavage/methylation domain-containing protein